MTAWLGLATGGLVLVYWISTLPVESNLTNSSYRTIVSLLIGGAVLFPCLSSPGPPTSDEKMLRSVRMDGVAESGSLFTSARASRGCLFTGSGLRLGRITVIERIPGRRSVRRELPSTYAIGDSAHVNWRRLPLQRPGQPGWEFCAISPPSLSHRYRGEGTCS